MTLQNSSKNAFLYTRIESRDVAISAFEIPAKFEMAQHDWLKVKTQDPFRAVSNTAWLDGYTIFS